LFTSQLQPDSQNQRNSARNENNEREKNGGHMAISPCGALRRSTIPLNLLRLTSPTKDKSMYQDIIRSELNEAAETLNHFLSDDANIHTIQRAAVMLADSFKAGGKVLSCGNGGSHCDAMHFAEELTGRYRENRPGYPAIAISDVSHLSCVSNDFGYDHVFSRYVEAVGRSGDVLLGISTSGNSANIIKAVEAARAQGMKVITLTGKDGGKMAGSADIEIRVPHFGYADRIQEIHIKVIHILMLLIEKEMVR
jgi:D-sedoheptulose 7-phosphate isomerase